MQKTSCNNWTKVQFVVRSWPVCRMTGSHILAIKLKGINWDCMNFGDFPVNFELISLTFCKVLFFLNPNSPENLGKWYSVFQKNSTPLYNPIQLMGFYYTSNGLTFEYSMQFCKFFTAVRILIENGLRKISRKLVRNWRANRWKSCHPGWLFLIWRWV